MDDLNNIISKEMSEDLDNAIMENRLNLEKKARIINKAGRFLDVRYLKIVISVLLVVILVLLGCNPPTAPDPSQPKSSKKTDEVVGKWTWLLSNGGGGIVTPQSLGYRIAIQFDSDSTYSQFKNDTLEYQYPYTIFWGKYFFMKDSAKILSFSSRQPSCKIDFYGQDTLELTVLAVDGGYARYLRVK